MAPEPTATARPSSPRGRRRHGQQVTRYRQPPPPAASGLGLFRRILLITLLGVTSLILGAAGGGYLWFHQSSPRLRAHTPAVVKALRSSSMFRVANRAAIALVVGYDHRAGEDRTYLALGHADADPRRPVDEVDLAALVPARPRRPDLLPGRDAVVDRPHQLRLFALRARRARSRRSRS